MVEGLGTNVLIVVGIVGIVMVLLGMGLSNLYHRRRAQRLTAEHGRQVQMLQQAITDRGQEIEAQKASLTQAGNRLAEQGKTLQQKEEELRHAQDEQQRMLALATEIERVSAELTEVKTEVAQLETKNERLQETVAEQTEGLAQAKEESTKLQEQIAQLTTEAEKQSALLAQAHTEYQHELTLRQNITTEIGAIYQRLQSGDSGSSKAFPSTAEYATAHDAMDQDISASPIDDVTKHLVGDDSSAKPTRPNLPATTTSFSTNGSDAESQGYTTPSAAHVDGSTERLTQFLAERGITITQLAGEESFDPVLNGLANFLGTHYESVKPIYQQIKRNMQVGGDFTISLKGEPPKTISLICQFGKKLYDVALLEQYRYFRSPQYLLRAKTTQLPAAQNFFSGQWLERYIIQQVQDAIGTLKTQTNQQIDFGYLANPRISLANEQEGELDLLFHLNDQIYWIETKSGDYQQHISKYSMIARTLNLNEKHALMVLTDIPASRSAELTALFGMGVCALEEFQKSLLVTLRQDLALPGRSR